MGELLVDKWIDLQWTLVEGKIGVARGYMVYKGFHYTYVDTIWFIIDDFFGSE